MEADRQHLKVYLVGGIVRDLIIKRKNLDLDLVVEGNAINFAQHCARVLGFKIKSYGQFGTSTLEGNNGLRLDFATARCEKYPQPGALPIVQEGSLKDDLFRRDFTINTLAIAIHDGHDGQLMDAFGGLSDLKNKKIRILHDQSFVDDPTRILRAVRFEQRFHFKIERKTLALLKKAVTSGRMDSVKPARYFVEFKKILMESEPRRHLKRLSELKAFEWLDPEFKLDLQATHSLPGQLSQMRKKIRCCHESKVWLFNFMALVEKSNPRLTHRILERFPFKREEKKSILQITKLQDIIGALSRRDLMPSEVYRLLKPLTDDAILYFHLRAKKNIVCQRIDCFLGHDIKVKLNINGKDLEHMGFSSGPNIGETLDKVLYQKIDGNIRSKKDELRLALKLKITQRRSSRSFR